MAIRTRLSQHVAPLLWGKAEIRAALGIGSTKLELMLRAGELPPRVVLGHSKKGWLPEDVIAWIKTRREKPRGKAR
jgi:predicted DNA-binding transcriptional regulator AlpA